MRTLTPRSRRAWRVWLGEHHETVGEVWLVFYKKHAGKPTLSYADAVEEALCFGWIDGIKKSLDAERYTHRFTPRRDGSRWSATNRQRVAQLTAAGLMAPAGLRRVAVAKERGTWDDEVRSRVHLAVPAELEEALRKNSAARVAFASLAPSYRRQYIGWIASAQREATRLRRVVEAIALLERGEKLGMR